MQFLIGAAGAILVLGILVFGVAVGWRAHAKYAVQKTNEKATEEELRKIKDQEDAFRFLNGYSVENAYGLVSSEGSETS